MAQLNCPTCSHGMMMDQWGNMMMDPQKSGSNMSLNIPNPSFPSMPNMAWMNQMNPMNSMNPMGTWHGAPPSMGMFPYPIMMPNMTPDAQSRIHSRAASPTPSAKSRKSQMSRRKYKQSDDTDDEMDRRSVFSYADKSERKSVRERAERARVQRELKDKREDRSSLPREVATTATNTNKVVVEKRPALPEKVSIHRNAHNDNAAQRSDRSSVPRSITSEKVERIPPQHQQQNKIQIASSESELDNISDDKNDEQLEEIANEPDYDQLPDEFPKEQDIIEEKTDLPSIPQDEWECEHCTFVNPSGTRVCTVCCKTPTSSAIKILKSSSISTSPIPSQKKSAITSTKQQQSQEDVIDYKTNKELNIISKIGQDLKLIDKTSSIEEYERKKGRNRKISFWPGTKFSPFHAK